MNVVIGLAIGLTILTLLLKRSTSRPQSPTVVVYTEPARLRGRGLGTGCVLVLLGLLLLAALGVLPH